MFVHICDCVCYNISYDKCIFFCLNFRYFSISYLCYECTLFECEPDITAISWSLSGYLIWSGGLLHCNIHLLRVLFITELYDIAPTCMLKMPLNPNHPSIWPPSSSIWPHLSYGLVRSKREYYHNCSLVLSCVAFCSCTLIWAAYRFCLPDLASSHWVHSLCLGYFVCARLFSCVISACML